MYVKLFFLADLFALLKSKIVDFHLENFITFEATFGPLVWGFMWKIFMKSCLFVLLSLLFLSLTTFAQITSVPEIKPDPAEELMYTCGVRIGLGYAATFQKFHFDSPGLLDGYAAEVLSHDVDDGFTSPNFAMNLEFKIGIPKPFQYFAVGLDIDYNIVPIDGMQFEVSDGFVYRNVTEDDITDVHVVSIIAFLEFRYPIAVGSSFIAPYARIGTGLTIYQHDNHDLIEIRNASGNFMMALGVEYFVNKQFSIFLEPRYHYSKTDVKFTPFTDNTKFLGNFYASNISLLVGVNYYFGTGKDAR